MHHLQLGLRGVQSLWLWLWRTSACQPAFAGEGHHVDSHTTSIDHKQSWGCPRPHMNWSRWSIFVHPACLQWVSRVEVHANVAGWGRMN